MLWLDNKKVNIHCYIYFLAFMHDGAHAFLRYKAFFHYFRAFKTEILHIYSLTRQILKQLFPSVSVPSEKIFTSPLCGLVEYISWFTSTLGNNNIIVKYKQSWGCRALMINTQDIHSALPRVSTFIHDTLYESQHIDSHSNSIYCKT